MLLLSVLGTARAAPTTYTVSLLEARPRVGSTWLNNIFYARSHRNGVMVGVAQPIDDPGSRAFLFKDGVTRYLPTDTSNDSAFRVDSHGNAIGTRRALDGSSKMVRWRADGGVDELQSQPDAQGIRLRDISDKAQVVGMVFDVQSYLSSKAVVWEGTSPIELPLPADSRGNAFSEAMSISPDGRNIVGTLQDGLSATPQALVLWKERRPMVIDTGNDVGPYPGGVNDRGEVVLTALRRGQELAAFKLDAQGLHRLQPLILGTGASADAINKDGLVGGASDCQCVDGQHAVIWKERRALDLNEMLDPVSKADGWVVHWVYDIDDAGVIFAAGTKLGSWGYILLTPH
jgi:uncharacterized membrane protein